MNCLEYLVYITLQPIKNQYSFHQFFDWLDCLDWFDWFGQTLFETHCRHYSYLDVSKKSDKTIWNLVSFFGHTYYLDDPHYNNVLFQFFVKKMLLPTLWTNLITTENFVKKNIVFGPLVVGSLAYYLAWVNASLVVEFQRWRVLKSKLFVQESTCSKEILIQTSLKYLWSSVVGVIKVDYLDFGCEIFEILCELDSGVIACNF